MSEPSPATDARRGTITFDAWANEVARLLDVQVRDDDGALTPEGAALAHQHYALSVAFQVEELSPRQFVEGIEAAAAFTEDAGPPAPEASDEEVAAAQAAAEVEADGGSAEDQEDAALEARLEARDGAEEVIGSEDPQDPDQPQLHQHTPSFAGSQVFGEDGPEDSDRDEDPHPQAPFTPSDEHPAEEGENFAPPRDEVGDQDEEV